MHQQHVAGRKIGQQIFGAPADRSPSCRAGVGRNPSGNGQRRSPRLISTLVKRAPSIAVPGRGGPSRLRVVRASLRQSLACNRVNFPDIAPLACAAHGLRKREKQTMTDTGSFGAQEVPLADKQALVDDVFHSVARRYDLMNDLMSFGLHRAWKDALVSDSERRRKRRSRLRCSTSLAAPATSPFASSRRVVRDASHRLRYQPGHARRRPRARRGKGLGEAAIFTEANAEALPLGIAASTPVTIAFGIRNVPRIETALAEAYRVLRIGGRFLCLEFSTAKFPASTRSTISIRSTSFPRSAAPSPATPILSLSGGVDPPVSEAAGIRRHDAHGRFCAGPPSTHDRRHRGAAFRLAFVISALARSLPPRPRRLRFRPRGRFRRDRSGGDAAFGASACSCAAPP